MFDMSSIIKALLPPGVTPEMLMEHLGFALKKVHEVAAAVDRIEREQATQGAMLRQIIAESQSPVGNALQLTKEPSHVHSVDNSDETCPSAAGGEPGSGDTSTYRVCTCGHTDGPCTCA